MATRVTGQHDLEEQARSGDPRAFGELIRRWDDDLRGVVWSVVRSRTDTDDVMQTAYEKAFRSLGEFRQDASMRTWLYSICLRAAIDHSRYENRRRHESATVLDTRPGTSSTSDAAIGRTELASVLEMIDPESRGLLMLTVGLGYSFDEVAEIATIPRGTVASRVARAKRTIRDSQPSAATKGQS